MIIVPISQVLVVVFCILSGVGTPGIPGGIIPVMLPVMVSVNLPSEAIVIILGVDRLLDMCRTTLNVVGDLMLATFVPRGEEEAPTVSPPP